MNMIERCDEEFVSVVLGITCQFCGFAPGCRKERDRTEWGSIFGVHLNAVLTPHKRRSIVLASTNSLSISQQAQSCILHSLWLCLSPRKWFLSNGLCTKHWRITLR
ncbi:hypothetical protein HHX47_DHR9000309 [Lentinula edodes]|nr:hypothetical protein HHX47_DHR9000309 [Lentinula edodes]